MKKILYGLIGGVAVFSVLCVPVSAKNGDTDIAPTFVAESDETRQSAELWMGQNLLLAGNNLTVTKDAENGLFMVAGNSLVLENESEYGFVCGNIIKFAGVTERDLYIAGNSLTIARDAQIGRDVFAAGNELRVETDLVGDLSVTATRVVIEDNVAIDGNVNIDAEEVEIGDNVEIGGKLIYNDNAKINNFDSSDYDIEIYHAQEADEPSALTVIYGKLLSITSLLLVMALIIALCPRLHEKMQNESTARRSGINLATGCGVLVIVPVLALITFLTVVAAPLGIIALLAYFVAIYLAQGFTGFWLGHLIIEKLFKLKGNAILEVLVGVAILGLLALVPFVGFVTGLLSMVLGLGLIFNCLRPHREDKNTKKRVQKAKVVKGKK